MTKKQAIALEKTGWWKKVTAEEAALFQLFEDKLCMPFADFHAGVEKLLGRSVWTHEFAFARDLGGLREEAMGKAERPTLEQIIELIPAKKRIVIVGPRPGDGEGR